MISHMIELEEEVMERITSSSDKDLKYLRN